MSLNKFIESFFGTTPKCNHDFAIPQKHFGLDFMKCRYCNVMDDVTDEETSMHPFAISSRNLKRIIAYHDHLTFIMEYNKPISLFKCVKKQHRFDLHSDLGRRATVVHNGSLPIKQKIEIGKYISELMAEQRAKLKQIEMSKPIPE